MTKEFISGESPISTKMDKKVYNIVKKICKNTVKLIELSKITRGVHPYRKGGYGQSAFQKGPQIEKDISERPYHSKVKKGNYRPFIYGKDLKRLTPVVPKEYVNYGPWLAEPRNPDFFIGERLYSRKILSGRLIVTVETTNSVADQQVYITKPEGNMSAYYIAGILSSKLMGFYIRNYYDELNDAFPQIKVTQLKNLPIIPISDRQKSIREKIITSVKQILDLHKKLTETKDPRTREQLQRRINATDRKIDQLVYELYGLTEEEIKVVEESVG